MFFAEKFINDKASKVVNKIINQHNNELNKKDISQNSIITFLEEEKSKEKDEKYIADYDYIISLIKKWFTNQASFDAKKAQQTIRERLRQDEILKNKVIVILNKNQDMTKISKQMLHKNVFEELKNEFLNTKSHSGWILKK